MSDTLTTPIIGRNEPCPCGSRKKYKRCCGVNAAPKLSEPKAAAPGSPQTPNMFEGMDPQVITQFSQAIQKLPKGQMQRLQDIMQKAMHGKDVTAEAEEFEKTLPMDFQNLIHSWAMPADMEAALNVSQAQAQSEVMQLPEGVQIPQMTEEQARAVIAQAAAEGKISKNQADSLLITEAQASPASSATPPTESMGSSEESSVSGPKESSSKLGKLWRNISGKNAS